MKFAINAALVTIVGEQTIDQAALDAFLSHNGVAWQSDSTVAAEVLTEFAGRMCYMSFANPRPGGNAAYHERIREAGHGSVLEHAVYTLAIAGVSRSLTHEFVRHRAGFGYSQLSQRYVDSTNVLYIVPDGLKVEVAEAAALFSMQSGRERFTLEECQILAQGQLTMSARAGLAWLTAMAQASASYESIAGYLASNMVYGERVDGTEARKRAKGTARSVLPNATETKMTVTGNVRALRHFIEMRASREADHEIRALANLMYAVLKSRAPSLFADYQLELLPDGTFEITTPTDKV